MSIGDVVYHCVVRWLSSAKVLNRIAKLKDALSKSSYFEKRPVPELNEHECIALFAFLTDISNHLMTPNLKLQQKGQLIHISFCRIKAFERKLNIFEKYCSDKNLSLSNVGATQLQRVLALFCKMHCTASTRI